MSERLRRRALFLDRDGTVNVEVDYLRRVEDLRVFDGAPEAVRTAKQSGWAAVIVTNQAGVARGYFTLDTLAAIHARLCAEFADRGTVLDGIYYCPHHPDDQCACRKPKPGMLLRAAEELTLDLRRSWMIGDAASDLEAGRRAGCRVALVLTGYGRRTLESGAQPDLVADTLPCAIDAILALETAS